MLNSINHAAKPLSFSSFTVDYKNGEAFNVYPSKTGVKFALNITSNNLPNKNLTHQEQLANLDTEEDLIRVFKKAGFDVMGNIERERTEIEKNLVLDVFRAG